MNASALDQKDEIDGQNTENMLTRSDKKVVTKNITPLPVQSSQ